MELHGFLHKEVAPSQKPEIVHENRGLEDLNPRDCKEERCSKNTFPERVYWIAYIERLAFSALIDFAG